MSGILSADQSAPASGQQSTASAPPQSLIHQFLAVSCTPPQLQLSAETDRDIHPTHAEHTQETLLDFITGKHNM